jgi:hypothetical protein
MFEIIGNIPMRRLNGDGNGYFLRKIDGKTQKPTNKVDIMWMSPYGRKLFAQLSECQE